MDATWSVKIERLETRLAVGIYDDEQEPQPVWVSVTLTGLAPAVPAGLHECLDYEPLCRWLATEWPRSPHTLLLETRVNEVFDFAFGLDPRVHEVSVGLYKQRVSRYATAIGLERTTNRANMPAQCHALQHNFGKESNMSQASSELARFALTFAAASERGQTAAITALLEKHGAYIEEFTVFDDVLSGRFFLRTVFRLVQATEAAIATLRDEYAELRSRFRDSEGQIHDLQSPMRVLLMVSKADHCLRDLLDQWRRHELEMDIVAVASNHLDLGPLAMAEGLPFHHLPIMPDTKPQQEAALLALIDATGAELVVLARYMQVLSAPICERLAGRVINIHHSFLPGFKGARPYAQAHARGVKLIGATAHFATTDLDEGPIIEQIIERVDHAFSPEQLLSTGRHVECLALGRALRYVIERRVFINGLRTVVLR